MESKAYALQKSGLLFQGRHITKGVYPLLNFILCHGLETLNDMLETSVRFSCFRCQILWQQLWPWHVSSGVHSFVIIPDFICCTSCDFFVDIAKNVSVPTPLETRTFFPDTWLCTHFVLFLRFWRRHSLQTYSMVWRSWISSWILHVLVQTWWFSHL